MAMKLVDRATPAASRRLVQKLGLKAGQRAVAVNPPQDYAALTSAAPIAQCLCAQDVSGLCDFVHVFASTFADLRASLPRVEATLRENGAIWVSWPRAGSSVPTDLSGETVRTFALSMGLVDTKSCTVDATWSALKLVRRRVH